MSNVSGLRECWSDFALNNTALNVAKVVDNDLHVAHLTCSLDRHCVLKTEEQYTVIQNDVPTDEVEETIYLNESEPDENTETEKEVSSSQTLNDQLSCFDVIPEELITHILSFIPLKELYLNVALVCKRWRELALSPILWQYLDVEDTISLTPECLAKIICKHCSLLKRLNLRNQDQMIVAEMLAIARACPMLHELTLSFCGEVVETAKIFANHCPKLQLLNMEGCNVTDDCLKYLTKLPLRGLNVSHCINLSDEGMKSITSKCHNLIEINFDGVQWITDDAVFVMVQNCFLKLEKLWLDGDNLTDASVKTIAKCQNLKVFSLSFCDNLTDESLTGIQQMKKLYSLRLKKGVGFSASGLAELFFHLDVNLMKNVSGILFLSLPECSTIDDTVMQVIAQSCPNLITLNLSWCWDITDPGLRHVIINCKQMERLNICGLTDVQGECLLDLPKLMPKLVYLDASQCNAMSDEALLDMVDAVPNITVIDYYTDVLQPRLH